MEANSPWTRCPKMGAWEVSMNTRPESSSPVSDDGELVEQLLGEKLMIEKIEFETRQYQYWETDIGKKAADRILSLREAGEALVTKLDESQPHIDGAFAFMALHGDEYSGPQYGEALNAFRAALQAGQHKE